ncbi:MAG: ADOP family duplicated permease [Longimicrobiales bacterium]
MTRPSPPRLAEHVVRWAVGRGDVAEGILGDLVEEFHARSRERGPGHAARWFWVQSLTIATAFRVRGGSVRNGGRPRGSVPAGLREETRDAARSLGRAPGFTALAVGILAAGVGSATAVFDSFDSVVATALPVTDPGRLVTLRLEGHDGTPVGLAPREIAEVAAGSRSLRAVAGALDRTGTMPVTESERPLVLDFAFVTAGFFDVLGTRPALGRLFHPSDASEGAPPVAVVSHATWRREFGGSADVLGRRLVATQYQGSYEIVGVAPAGLDYPVGADYWILPGPRAQQMGLVARIDTAATVDAVRAGFLTRARSVDERRSRPEHPTTATVTGLTDAVVGDARPLLTAMAGAAGLLLLIACANVAGLTVMRAARRAADTSLRRALGASTARIVRGYVLEGVLLAGAGGALGLGLSVVLVQALRAAVPAALPRGDLVGGAGLPAGIALGVTLVVVLLVAVVPSLVAARYAIAPTTYGGRTSSATRGAVRTRRSLVAAQVALAVVVLFGAGLLARTLHRLAGLPLGYRTEGVHVLELGIDRRGLAGPSELADLLDGVFRDLRATPEVEAVTPLMARPFTGGGGVYRTVPHVEGRTDGSAGPGPPVPLESGGTELFRTLGIPILRGRGFEDGDREDAPNVAVVSRDLAERLWPGGEAVGERIRLSLGRDEWWTVVGVAGDTRFRSLRETTPTIYLPWRQFQILPMAWTVAVRTDVPPEDVVPALRRTLRSADPRVYLWTDGTLDEHLGRGPLAAPRRTAVLLSGFGLAALLLATVGLYGVMTLAVLERNREFGIRRALGASEGALRSGVLADALRTVATGGAVGLAVALPASRILAPLLFEVRPADPVTIAGVAAVMLAAGATAAYLPVRRATRVDPRVVLQGD